MEKAGKKQSTRVGEIDLLRGFGIILMVMGHIEFGTIFDHWIHVFHMPMWFLISGYFLNTKKSTGSFLFGKIKTLLVPYVFFGLAYEILALMFGYNQFLGILYPNSVQVPFNGALWFLPALFLAEVFAFFLIKYLPAFLSYPLLAVAAVIGNFHPVNLPLSADSALVGAGFLLLGYCLKKYFDGIMKGPVWTGIVGILLFSVLAFRNGAVNVRANEYAIIPLFWLNAVGMICSFWILFCWINRNLNWYLLRILKKIGEKSLYFLCINQFAIFVFQKFIPVGRIAGKGFLSKGLLLAGKLTELLVISGAILVFALLFETLVPKITGRFVVGKHTNKE